jgi:tetratricopeptide (TPR) repeat protein
MNEFQTDPAPRWHWIESDHWEIQFEGLPRRIPWLDTDVPPTPENCPASTGKDFPVQRLYQAVTAMLASDPSPPADPRFGEFVARMEKGDELLAALERGDFIAAAGVLREMHRVSRPCGSLLFNEAYLAKRGGDLEGARDLYRRITEMCPDVEMTWRIYGELSEQTGDTEEAIRAYKEARRILPNHEQATLGLERLGELIRLRLRDEPDRLQFVTKEELRALQTEEIEEQWSNPDALRGLGREIIGATFFPDLALHALTRAVELDPLDSEGRRNFAVALRLNGKIDEAIAQIYRVLSIDPQDAWALFHLAECHVEKGDVPAAWENLHDLLKIDPNHEPALHLLFLARDDRSPETKEDDLLKWSLPRPAENFPGSWQGHLMLADAAWKRGQREQGVRLAADAYKIAPNEEAVFLTYTGMLSRSGEHEWVAALTKPRLREGERSPAAFHNFATALDAMGLRDEAAATLGRALAELDLRPEERAGFTDLFDDWTGRFAYSEIEVETQDGARESLRRNICSIVDGKLGLRLFETGMGFPQRLEIPVTFKKPRSEFDFTVEQRNTDGDPEQTLLGTFTVREIDPEHLATESVRLLFHLTTEARIGLGAFQGERKLGVTWSLVPPPRHESAEI